MSAKIIISRKSEWINQRKDFIVMIDDIEVGVVKNGGSEEFLVEPGAHSVGMKMGIYSGAPKTVIINGNENKFLKARTAWKFYDLFLVLFILVPFLNFMIRNSRIKLLLQKHIILPHWVNVLQLLMIAPLIILTLYHLIFGRKKYLILEDDNSIPFNS